MLRILLAAATAVSLLWAPALAEPADRALDDVRILSADAMEGRMAGSPGGARARTYIAGRMREIGLEVTEQPFTFQEKGASEVTGVNLIARIEGAGKDGRIMVVTAHYDHLGVQKGQIYNGADDNASGIAGLLAIAADLKAAPPRHTVYLVALDAEEMNLRGAAAFVAQPPVPLARIALNINFDMISKNAKGELYAAGGTPNAWVREALKGLAAQVPVTLKQGHDSGPADDINNWTFQSDHAAFAKAGIPWVYFGVEDHPEYHQPTDDFDTVPRAFFAQAVTSAVIATRYFDAELDSLPARAP